MAIKVKLETELNGVHAGLNFVKGVHVPEGEEAEAKARKIAEILGYEIIDDEKSEAKKPSRKSTKKDKDEDK